MRLITMFYLTVFAAALLVMGVWGSQRISPDSVGGAKVLVYTTDSIPASSVEAPMPSGKQTPEVPQNGKQDFFSFNFASILQWLIGFTGKTFSHAEPVSSQVSVAQPLYS